MRLLVTRPAEDARPLKAKLERLGHEAILSPLLEIVPLPSVEIPHAPYQAIALTSANAIRCLSGHDALAVLRSVPVLAVGPQSAEAARQASFKRIVQAGGDGVGLAQHIIATASPKSGPLLYLSGRDTASDFSGLLERAGFSVDRIIVYEARAAAKLARGAARAEGVLLYSPRSARLWLKLSDEAGIAAARLVHYCLSPNIAAILPDGIARRVAPEPAEAALLEVIGRAE